VNSPVGCRGLLRTALIRILHSVTVVVTKTDAADRHAHRTVTAGHSFPFRCRQHAEPWGGAVDERERSAVIVQRVIDLGGDLSLALVRPAARWPSRLPRGVDHAGRGRTAAIASREALEGAFISDDVVVTSVGEPQLDQARCFRIVILPLGCQRVCRDAIGGSRVFGENPSVVGHRG